MKPQTQRKLFYSKQLFSNKESKSWLLLQSVVLINVLLAFFGELGD